MVHLADIGQHLVERRRALGLSQRELGSRLGVAQPQIARWEANAYESASLKRVAEVAAALDFKRTACPSHWLPRRPRPTRPRFPRRNLKHCERWRACPSHPEQSRRSRVRITWRDSRSSAQCSPSSSVPTSDVDLLVTYEPDAAPSLFDLADHETELEALLRRPVDLVSRAGIETSENSKRKRPDSVLSEDVVCATLRRS